MKVTGKGSVTRLEKKPRSKCRKWRLRVPTDQGSKTRRFPSAAERASGIEGTYTQAMQAKDAFIAELMSPYSDKTFREHSERWLRIRKSKGLISDSTERKYRDDLKVLNAEFGDDRLCDIDKLRAENGLENIKYHGGKRVKVMSGTYMNQLYTLMKAVLEDAVGSLIEKNPLERCEAPKVDTAKRQSLSRETFAFFLVTLLKMPLDPHIVAVLIAVLAGLRRGEIVALKWHDVHDGVIHVRRAYIEKAKRIGKTKSAFGVRDVPLVEQLEEALAAWKPIQAEMLDATGVEQTEDTFVVASSAGTMMYPQNLGSWWSEVRGPLFGLDGIVLHELRHTYLTMLASKSSSQSLKSIAGWASLAMADTYVHDDESANREAVSELGNMINFEKAKITQREAM